MAARRGSGRFELQFELEYPEILRGNISKLHTACSCLPPQLCCDTIYQKEKQSGTEGVVANSQAAIWEFIFNYKCATSWFKQSCIYEI